MDSRQHGNSGQTTSPEPPIVAYLKAVIASDKATVREHFRCLSAWSTLEDVDRERIGAELVDAVRRLVDSHEALITLPATTVCICPNKECRRVVLPAPGWGGIYTHCGRVWMPSGRKGHIPLPDDFWDAHMPGDTYQGLIAADWAEDEEDEESRRPKARARKSA